jgi:hypothetical protein
MKYTLRKNGDILEKEACEFVVNKIPNYELLWALFIGNDGHNKMANIPNISSDFNEDRMYFSQHHYTILESIYFMHEVYREEANTNGINTIEDYRKTTNNLISFFAYAGRIRDNIYNCFIRLRYSQQAENSKAQLTEFYHQRHIIIHGSKIPYTIDDLNLIGIPFLRKDKNSFMGFEQNQKWDEISNYSIELLSDYMKRYLNEFTPIINSLLGSMYGIVKNIMDTQNLKITPPKNEVLNIDPPGFSGSSGYGSSRNL